MRVAKLNKSKFIFLNINIFQEKLSIKCKIPISKRDVKKMTKRMADFGGDNPFPSEKYRQRCG